MLNNKDTDTTNDIKNGEYYNVNTGAFETLPSTPAEYGKSNGNKYIVVEINDTAGTVDVKWVK